MLKSIPVWSKCHESEYAAYDFWLSYSEGLFAPGKPVWQIIYVAHVYPSSMAGQINEIHI